MMIETQPPASPPEGHLRGQQAPPQPAYGKAKKRGLIWVVILLIVAGVAGSAVWRAGHPIAASEKGDGGGGRGGGRNAPNGPVPVVVTKVTRSSVPVFLNGLGNV